MPILKTIDWLEPVLVMQAFYAQKGTVWLDSARQIDAFGRYSIIAIDPFETLYYKNGVLTDSSGKRHADPFETIQYYLDHYNLQGQYPDLPFSGGLMGFLGYECARALEKLPAPNSDPGHFPDMVLGVYDLAMIFDHQEKTLMLVSTGFPEKKSNAQQAHATDRLETLCEQLSNLPSPVSERLQPAEQVVPEQSEQSYQNQVQRVLDYIRAGDIFEANLTQRFWIDWPKDNCPFAFYLNLRKKNPAPFAAYQNFDDAIILSASPERFLKLESKQVYTYPIKGTCPRYSDPIEDKKAAEALQKSEKDRAENIMIVDLMRNDLSKVCEPGSIQVPKICQHYAFKTVHHLVSEVQGTLKPEATPVDLLRATFPAGSITGAPKVRAMEIIAELERSARGPYCGALLYLSFNGNMDSAVTIRTIALKSGVAAYGVGGAVVIDSIPKEEYQETLDKGAALSAAFLNTV